MEIFNIEVILEPSLRCFTTQRLAAEIVQSPGRRRQHQGATTSAQGERRQGERGKEEGRKSISEECQRQVRLIQKSGSSRCLIHCSFVSILIVQKLPRRPNTVSSPKF